MKLSSLTILKGLSRPSIDYYAFRGLPFEQFQALQVVYAVFSELRALPECSTDILVVRHKTHFWLTEIQAAYQGIPQHPIAQDLQALLKTCPLSHQDWLGILTAVEMDSDRLLLENETEIRGYADKLYGSLYRLISQALALKGDCQDLALARTLLMYIQHPDRRGVTVKLPENTQEKACQLFELAGKRLGRPLSLLARLYRRQALKPMLKLSPLETLWLSIRERL